MTHIDTSAEACERLAYKIDKQWPVGPGNRAVLLWLQEASALIRQLVCDRDKARERALDEAAAAVSHLVEPPEIILSLKGPKP